MGSCRSCVKTTDVLDQTVAMTSELNFTGSSFDETTHNELLLVIQHYLSHSPCQQAAEILRKEIQRYQLLPKRYDYTGIPHCQSVEDYERMIPASQPSIVSLIERLNALVCNIIPPVISGLPLRIFSSKKQALIRTPESGKRSFLLRNVVARAICSSLGSVHSLRILGARQLGCSIPSRHLLHRDSMQSLELHYRIFGHLSSIFCVAFDRTGQYLITGADDNLVKVWSVANGFLRFTLRGHSAEISDMTVSDDNCLLATGSVDKTVRVWSLRTAAHLYHFRSHTAMVTLISFLPFVCGNTRYLMSAGGDCIVNFYKYTTVDGTFDDPQPVRFYERTSSGSRVVSSCHSPGGNLVVVGDTHHFIRIYRLTEATIEKLHDIDAHADRVDSLVWAHSGLRFASGSRDGIAKAWRFQCSEWLPIVFDTKLRDEKTTSNSRNAYKVTMLCWSLEDDFLVTSGSDHAVRIWDSTTGVEIRKLVGHKDDAFVLTAHPVYREYVISAGHDGLLMVWNIYEGAVVKRHQNQTPHSGNGALFDFAISPDGTLVATVDSHGRLSVYGVGTNQRAKTMPKQQFFNTDYMPLLPDEHGVLLDEWQEIEPHLMPPPKLVNASGALYSEEIQRLVAGRDYFSMDFGNERNLFEPPWIRRDMVQRLRPSTINIINSRLVDLRENEAKIIRLEESRQKISDMRAGDDRHLGGSSTMASRRRRAAHPTEALPHLPQSPLLMDQLEDDFEVEELPSESGDSSYVTLSHSEEEEIEEEEDEETELSEDTSDSDYRVEEPGSRRRQNAEGSSVRSTLEDSASTLRSNTREASRKRKRVIISDDEEDESAPAGKSDLPGPSGLTNGQLPRTRSQATPVSKNVSRRIVNSDSGPTSPELAETSSRIPEATPAEAAADQSSHRKSRAPVAEFPSWMRLVRPMRFPYVAQLGDEVVYFRQGHELYLDAVESQRLYPVSQRMRPIAELNAEEFCIVSEVKYSRKPFRLTAVKLARIDENGELTGLVFSVKYHDMENVPDFIILRHLYNESVARRYEPGDRIETILDNHWWTGTVDKKEAHDEENYPRSNWCCLTVKWDTGEDEKMSPWDVQPQQIHRRSGLASEEDVLLFAQYPRSEGDWGMVGADEFEGSERRLIDAIHLLGTEEDVRPFCHPVNLAEYPDYASKVDYPVDLETIAQRAENKFYRRLLSMEQDIRYIAINANIFNVSGSPIVRNSRVLVETLIRYIRDNTYADVKALFTTLKEGPDHELIEHNRRQCVRVPIRQPQVGTSASHRYSNHDEVLSNGTTEHEPEWILECERVIYELLQDHSARHFVYGGSDVIAAAIEDGCVDLNSVVSAIERRTYKSPFEINETVEKLMQTCRNALDNKRSPIYRDSLTFSALFGSKMAPILAKWQRMQQQQGISNENMISEEKSSSGGHCLRRRSGKFAHTYNTRSRNDEEDKETSTPSTSRYTSRSGRVIIPNYRNLNGMRETSTSSSSSSFSRKLRISSENSRGTDRVKNKGKLVRSHSRHAYATRNASESGECRSNSVSLARGGLSSGPNDDDDLPGPSGIGHVNAGNMNGGMTRSRRQRHLKLIESIKVKNEESSKSDDNDEDVATRMKMGGVKVSSVDGAKRASFCTGNSSSGTRRSTRVSKRRVYDSGDNDDSPAGAERGRMRNTRKRKLRNGLRTTSPGSSDSVRERPFYKRKTVTRSEVQCSSKKIKKSPESGDISEYETRSKSRPRRSRNTEVNYMENDLSEEEYTTCISGSGRVRRQRAFR